MTPFNRLVTGFKAITLDSANAKLHEQLGVAISEGRALRLASKSEHGRQVNYLRERSWKEFGQESWNALFGKGEVAAAAKQHAWNAVHQALSGQLVSMHAEPGSNRQAGAATVPVRAPGATSAGAQTGQCADNALGNYFAAKQMLKDARLTAAAIYSHIMGLDPQKGRVALISKQLSIRYCDALSLENATATSATRDAFSKAWATERTGTIAGAKQCIKAYYLSELNAAEKSGTGAQTVTIAFQYKAREVFQYGYQASDWADMHAYALQQAIAEFRTLNNQAQAITVAVDDEQAFAMLQLKLEEAEDDALQATCRGTFGGNDGRSRLAGG